MLIYNNFLNNENINIYVIWRCTKYLTLFFVEEMQTLLIWIMKRKWDVLFNNQINSGDYSKTPFLLRSVALFIEIMLSDSIRKITLFRQYKYKLIRSINSENTTRHTRRANTSGRDDHNFFQIVTKWKEYFLFFRI